MKIFLIIFAAAMLFGKAWADDFDVAMKAYESQDYVLALKHFKLSATQGDVMAQANLGTMYDKGYGVVQDYAEAAKWYRMAAVQGNALAQYSIGSMYGTGQGVQLNYAEAVKWYRLAASQGIASAQFNLGGMYDKGQGVLQDYIRAHMWWNLAAMSNHTNAIKNRDSISKQMTGQQIGEAQKMARDCQQRKFKDCD